MEDTDGEPAGGRVGGMEARLERLERAQAALARAVAAQDAAPSLRADVSRRRLRKREADLEAAGGGAWSWRPQTSDPRFSPACHRVLGPGRRGLALGRRGDDPLPERPVSPTRIRDSRDVCLARVHPDDLVAFERELERFLTGRPGRLHRHVRVRDHEGRWLRVVVAAGATHHAADGRVSRVAGLILLCPEGNSGVDAVEERCWKDATLQEMADRRDELAELSRLADHDLRSPLRTIVGFSEHLDGLVVGDADAADAVARIRRAGARMITLVDRVTVYASLARGQRRDDVVDLGEVAAEVLHRLRDRVDAADATVEIGDLPVLRGDRAMLLHVVEQLLDNAIRYCNTRPAIVRVTAETAGAAVRIHFTDSGSGFDPAMAEAMFEPFVGIDGRGGGRGGPGGGLGLSIARRAVERHGGTIVAEAAPDGTGSRFVVTLPVRPGISRSVTD